MYRHCWVILILLFLRISRCKCTAAVDGEWAFWSDWSSCSASCDGGTQSRERDCSDPAPSGGGLDCPGDEQQLRNCSQWHCPDCMMSCPPGGTLDVTCSLCMCDDQITVTGRVRDGNFFSQTPLPYVEIFASTREWSSLTVTDCAGYFTLPDGLCRDQLQLRFLKEGYDTEDDVYDVPATGEMLVKMYKGSPSLIAHPVSVASGEGGQVSFNCTTSIYQHLPAQTFQWYHNDVLVEEQEAITGLAILIGIFTITNVQQSDAGYYHCRAVSKTGSTASRRANLLYLNTNGTPAALCELKSDAKQVILHSSCTAILNGQMVSSYFAGTCVSAFGDGGPACCQADQMELVNVTCNDISYQLTMVASCGWTPCEKQGLVWIEGLQRLNEHDEISVLTKFTASIFPTRPSSTEKLIYSSKFGGNYFSHLTNLKLHGGVSRYRLVVDLRGKPAPRDVFTDESTVFILPDSSADTSVGQLLIPDTCHYQTLFGQDITGIVSLYQDMAEIHNTSGLQTAPHMLLEQGDQQWLMRTYGLLWFNVKHTGQDAILACSATLRLDRCAVRLSNYNLLRWPKSLMILDSKMAGWQPSSSLEAKGNCIAESVNLHFPVEFPVVNIAHPYERKELCELAVYIYRTADTSEPLSGELVAVDSRSKKNNQLVSHFRYFTGTDGKACLLVPCGEEHTVTVLSMFEARPSDTHHLPNNYQFTNTETAVVITSPKKNQVSGSAGPIHRYICKSCQQCTASDYHFAFHLVDAPIPDHLSIMQPLPDNQLSWYQAKGSSHRGACFIRIGVQTLSRSAMQLFGISRPSSSGEVIYGTALAGVGQVYNSMAEDGDSFSCLEVRCPFVHVLGTDPPATDTFVEVHLHPPVNTECKLSWLSPYLQEPLEPVDTSEAEVPPVPPLHILSTTNSSLSLRLNAVSYSDDYDSDYYIPGFYRMSERYEKAQFLTHADCLADEKALLALFDCADGMVDSQWWDEPKVPGQIWELA